MASIEIAWAETGPISIFDVARQLGFDLNRFASQPAEVKLSIRKLTVDRVVQQMREVWRESYDNDYAASKDFNRIANGVYVSRSAGASPSTTTADLLR